MSPPSPSHNMYFVPINLQQIKQDLYSMTDDEIDDLFKKTTEFNNSMETEHKVKGIELGNDHVSTNIENSNNNETLKGEDNVIGEETERVLNCNIKEEIKDEPMTCHELGNNHVNINSNNNETLIGEDNVIRDERERVLNFNVKEEIKDEPMTCHELGNDYVNINSNNNETLIGEDNVIHEERERVLNFNVKEEIKDEPMTCHELGNDHANINSNNNETLIGENNVIYEERESVLNFKVREEIKEEPMSYKEWDSIKIENSDLNDANNETLTGEDNVIHEGRERVRNYNVDVHVEELKTEVLEEAGDEESAGAAPAEKCQQTLQEIIQDDCRLISGGKHILEKLRTKNIAPYVTEEATSSNIDGYVLRGTGTENNRQASTNSYSDTAVYKSNTITSGDDDCGDVLDENRFLLEDDNNITHPNSPQQFNISHKETLDRTGVVDKQTETLCEKKLECEICKVTFTRRSGLTNHYKVHTGEKPYECEVCHRRLTERSSFKRHLRIHTGEKPYECNTCKVKFTRKGSLNKHLRIHTGEKPFECDICKARFNRKDVLNLHIKLHSREKSFECEICKLIFKCNVTLTYHLNTHTAHK